MPPRVPNPTSVLPDGRVPLGREDVRPVSGRPNHLGFISGRVVGPRQEPISGAEVSVCFARRWFRPEGGIESEFRDADAVTFRTDAEGRFEASFDHGGAVRVRASAPGFPTTPTEVREVPPPPYIVRLYFPLWSDREFARLRGRVVDPAGTPLPLEDLVFLFPGKDDHPETIDPIETVSRIAAMADPARSDLVVDGTLPDDKGAFELGVPRGGRWTVALFFRGRVVEERPWGDGDPEIEFRVDVEALRATLGELEVKVLDGATGNHLPGAKVLVERGGDRGGGGPGRTYRQPRGEPLRVPDLAPGPLTVRASAGGFAMVVAQAEIAPGATTRVELPLQPPARLRVRLVPVEGWLPRPPTTAPEYRDCEGRWGNVSWEEETETDTRWLQLGDLQPGEGFLLLAGNVLRIRVSPGSNPDVDFPIRRPRSLIVRYVAGKTPEHLGFRPLSEGLRTFFDGRVCLHSTSFSRPERVEGWVERRMDEILPPGRYTLELDPGIGSIVRREIEVGLDEVTTVAVDR